MDVINELKCRSTRSEWKLYFLDDGTVLYNEMDYGFRTASKPSNNLNEFTNKIEENIFKNGQYDVYKKILEHISGISIFIKLIIILEISV